MSEITPMAALIGGAGILLHIAGGVITAGGAVLARARRRPVDVGWAARLSHFGSFAFLLSLGLFIAEQPAADANVRLVLAAAILALSAYPLRLFMRRDPPKGFAEE